MLFKSIVDWWYYLLIVVIAIVVLFSTIPPVKSGQLSVFVAFGIILLSLGLPVWLLFTTYYRVSSDALRVKSGPFNWDIPLEEIHSVSPNRSSRSSPALSLDRLEIKYGRGQSILVSPKNREAFVKAIGHSYDGD